MSVFFFYIFISFFSYFHSFTCSQGLPGALGPPGDGGIMGIGVRVACRLGKAEYHAISVGAVFN